MPVVNPLAARLRGSLNAQEAALRRGLVLNPAENFPFPEDLEVAAGITHGLYNSDKVRDAAQRAALPIVFAGRRAQERDAREIYETWAIALHAAEASLRLLSGLHAHVVVFMSIASSGQRVLVVPERAGGHASVRPILERLGLIVIDMVCDDAGMRIDIAATLDACTITPVDFVLVDRSEGLVFEDFSAFTHLPGATTVFDASHYLANIIHGDHPNPLDWGFDLLVSSVHKNFPGPQKALVATRQVDATWQRLLSGLSTFVSNMHSSSTYAAGLTLSRTSWLADYSRDMLATAVLLEEALADSGVHVVRRRTDSPATHHVWLREPSQQEAFRTFEALEACKVMTNYRVLPYSLGHGIRLGTAAAVRTGMLSTDVPELAQVIAGVQRVGATPSMRSRARVLSETIWSREDERVAKEH